MFNQIQQTVINTLANVQTLSGRTVPSDISGATCPMLTLEGFDSLNAIEAIAQISVKIGHDLDPMLFTPAHSSSELSLSIDQITQKIIAIIEKQETGGEDAPH